MRNNHSPLLYVKILLIIIVAAAIVSFFFKMINLVSGSKFKGDSFNVLYLSNKSKLIHIKSQEKKIYIVDLSKEKKLSANRLVNSAESQVLYDAMIIDSKKNDTQLALNKFLSFSDFYRLLTDGYKFENMNELDLIKIYFLSKLTSNANREHFDSIDDTSITSLADKNLLNEQASMAVVNTSEIDGLGLRMSIALKRAGYNVVSVSSAKAQKSKITTNNISSKTIERLKRALNIPVVATNQTVYDITFYVGKDIID